MNPILSLFSMSGSFALLLLAAPAFLVAALFNRHQAVLDVTDRGLLLLWPRA